MKALRILLAAVAVTVPSAAAHISAADGVRLRVLGAGNMEATLAALAGGFQRTTGHTLSIAIDRGSAVKMRIRAGEPADVIVVMRSDLDELTRDGRIDPKTVVNVARSFIGVVVRAGAPMPDLSTADAVKRALLAAPSIAYSDPARATASGVFFAGLLERLGIAEGVKGKSRLVVSDRPVGEEIAALVASGGATIGIGQVSEMRSVAGVVFVTPLARELQPEFVVAAGMVSTTHERAASQAFLDYLTSSAAAPVIEANGMKPR
jgi:molybdate transport system substrate-binding protein